MPGKKFVRLDVSKGDLARRLRKWLLHAQETAFKHHKQQSDRAVFRIAVSGGSLPKTLGEALRENADGQFQLDKWRVYLADERAVPLDHADSNYALVKSEWVDRIPEGQPKPTVFPIEPTKLENLAELAEDYTDKLIQEFVEKDSVLVPVFDAVLLGCGPDGHTCSLFPGHDTLAATLKQDWVLPIDNSPKPPPRRVTLSMAVVTHAHHIAFVATGGSKEDIMHQIFDIDGSIKGELSAEDEMKLLPCSIVNRHGRQVTWLVDEPAVAKVERRAEPESA